MGLTADNQFQATRLLRLAFSGPYRMVRNYE